MMVLITPSGSGCDPVRSNRASWVILRVYSGDTLYADRHMRVLAVLVLQASITDAGPATAFTRVFSGCQ
jgi:hypothetical protein